MLEPESAPERAREMCIAAHDSIGQLRKYTNLPYWTHPIAVAEIVSEYTTDPNVIAAAYLHDVIEDVYPLNRKYSYEHILLHFGERVMELVGELTDKYTKENYPDYRRAYRKELERRLWFSKSDEAKLIKLADLFDNTASIAQHDPGFWKVYQLEKKALLPYLDVCKPLYDKVYDQVYGPALI